MDKRDALHEAQAWAAAQAVPQLHTALLWHAVVEVGPREALGASPLGERFIIPILGGVFWGGPGHGTLSGQVRPGGADRQLHRPDGVRQLQALYEMQTEDGAVLTLINQVLIDDSAQPAPYRRSVIQVTAPQGPHDWLNRRIVLGTLQPLAVARPAVLIRAFLLG